MTSKLLTIETHSSEVAFTVKKLGFLTIKGTLSDFTGAVTFKKDALDTANFGVSIGASSIDTRNAKRDEHLRSKDFFHVSAHPQIHFKSTTVIPNAKGYEAVGQLSMLGISKQVSIPFSFQQGVFNGQFSLNRLDYKLGEKFPAFFIGKTIQISINCKTTNSVVD